MRRMQILYVNRCNKILINSQSRYSHLRLLERRGLKPFSLYYVPGSLCYVPSNNGNWANWPLSGPIRLISSCVSTYGYILLEKISVAIRRFILSQVSDEKDIDKISFCFLEEMMEHSMLPYIRLTLKQSQS